MHLNPSEIGSIWLKPVKTQDKKDNCDISSQNSKLFPHNSEFIAHNSAFSETKKNWIVRCKLRVQRKKSEM